MTRLIRVRAAAFLGIVGLATFPALAVSGHVVDPSGKPVAGAKACLIVSSEIAECVDTDAAGYYALHTSREAQKVEIHADGFLPVSVAAVDQESPVVLALGATLRVRVLDAATGETMPKGYVKVVDLSGHQRDGFPFNKAGVRISSLAAGTYVVRARADGYVESDPESVVLEAGRESELVVRLTKSAAPKP